MFLLSAGSWERSTASLTTVLISTGRPCWATLAPCSRESSMMSWTRAASRVDSLCIRLANRLTASGSSADDSSASASSEIAPTGVFSSWETLATKSLRTSSVRVNSVRSSASRRMYSSVITAARTCTMIVPWPSGPQRQFQLLFEDDAVPPHLGGHFQQLLVHHGVPADQAVGVGGRAGADHAVDRVDHHERAAEDGEHLRGAVGQRGVVDVDVDELALLLADPEMRVRRTCQTRGRPGRR